MSDLKEWSDEDLLVGLHEVDKGSQEVTDWEANFIESVFNWESELRSLSAKQREKIIQILEAYWCV